MPLLSNNNSGYWVQRGRLLCITHSEPLQTSLVGCCELLAQVLEIKVAIVHRYIPRNVCLITAGRFARSQHNKMNSFLPVWTVGECERSYQAMKRTKVKSRSHMTLISLGPGFRQSFISYNERNVERIKEAGKLFLHLIKYKSNSDIHC